MNATDPHLTAIVLLAHGSPDPDWCRPILAIQARMQALDPLRQVSCAYLDFVEPSLATTIAQLDAGGYHDAAIVPVFLSSGGNHFKRDIPALIATTAKHHPSVRLELVGQALGEEPEVTEALARAAFARVLLR